MRTLIGAFCATALTAMAFVPTTASATCTQSVYAALLFNGLSGGVVGGSYYSYFCGEPFGAGSTVTYYGYITSCHRRGHSHVCAGRRRCFFLPDLRDIPVSGQHSLYVASVAVVLGKLVALPMFLNRRAGGTYLKLRTHEE
jgi:hypothetical protein